MLHCRRPRLPAYVIDAGTLCRGIRAFCRSGAIRAGQANPAAVLLDVWLNEDVPAFEWVYSEETVAVYEAVLRRLGLSGRFVDRVIGIITQIGTRVGPPCGVPASPDALEGNFCVAAEAAEDAAIVTTDPARFPDTGRFRILSPAEALAGLSVHAGYAERAASLPSPGSPSAPTVQGWPT